VLSITKKLTLLFSLVMIASGAADHNCAPSNLQTRGETERDRILEAARRFAEEYVSNLPNFVCTQVVKQFEAKRPNHWRKGDVLTTRLSFNNGREFRTLQLVNSKPPGERRIWRTPLITEGEFGILLANVLGSSSQAKFNWHGWEVLRGKKLAVLEYAIQREHSTLRLALDNGASAVVAYEGVVYTDAENGSVYRITDRAVDIPRTVQTRSISTTLDYERVPIGDRTYLLPIRATVLLTTYSTTIRNDMDFTDYRKFTADSKITYSPTDGGHPSAEGPISSKSPPY